AAAANPDDPLGAVIAFYLSTEHCEERMDGCPVAALGPDAARQGADVKASFEAGIREYLEMLGRWVDEAEGKEPGGKAMAILSTMVGAMVRPVFAQNGTAGSEDQGTSTGHMGRGMMGGGMMSRGMMAGCSEMMHSMNAASSGRSTQSWATFSPMPKPCSLPVSNAYRWTILRASPRPTPSIHNTEPITMDYVIIIGGSFAGR